MYKKVVTLEELGIIIPLLTAIIIPVVIIIITRHLKGSETLTKTAIEANLEIQKIEEYIVTHKQETKEIYHRLENVERLLFNTCYRVDKIEREHESRKLD